MLEFLWPFAAYILPLPIIIYWLLPRAQKVDAALRVPFYKTAMQFEGSSANTNKRQLLRRLLLILCWGALVLAAARPQWIGEAIELPTNGRDLLIAVDISGSMGTEDMQINGRQATRLEVVKQVLGDFITRRKGDRIGLILFGTEAYLQTPLTFDRNTVRKLLEETPMGIAGGKTAIGDAIGLAVKRLHERPSASRVVILLTDGQNNAGAIEPVQASKIAAKEGVKIYTIGFGADEMVVPGLLFNRTINPSAELDEKTLSTIANNTGALYQRARDSSELNEIYAALDELEPIEQDSETYRPIKSLYYWPLGFALLLSFLIISSHPQIIIWFTQKMHRSQSVRAN